MWNKREDEPLRPSAPTPVSATPQPPQPPVVAAAPERREPAGASAGAGIGPSISIVGDVSGEEDLTILGKVEGKIVLPKHSVTIGHGGRVKADIQAKFAKLTKRVLPQAQSERIMALVLDLENLQDISVLIKALAR